MSTKTDREKLAECVDLVKIWTDTIIKMADAASQRTGPETDNSQRLIRAFLRAIQSNAAFLRKDVAEISGIGAKHLEARPASIPSREHLLAARNDAAVQRLIKRASRKTPIIGK